LISKRVLKTPKLCFMDIGLMAWLTRWISSETMMRGAKARQLFATWVEYPLEIKLSAKPVARMGQSFRLLESVAKAVI